jgi:hypothetical protein
MPTKIWLNWLLEKFYKLKNGPRPKKAESLWNDNGKGTPLTKDFTKCQVPLNPQNPTDR